MHHLSGCFFHFSLLQSFVHISLTFNRLQQLGLVENVILMVDNRKSRFRRTNCLQMNSTIVPKRSITRINARCLRLNFFITDRYRSKTSCPNTRLLSKKS